MVVAVPMNTDNCINEVMNFFNAKLSMNLNAPDVENAHPLPVGKGSKPSIIVRLRSRKIRDEILSKRKDLKGSGVSIKEDFTKRNVQLMSQLRNDERVENT